MKSFIITGTDSGAGKTHLACLMIKELRALHIDIVPFKPIECGDREDSRHLRESSGLDLSLEQINPIYYKSPASPYVAARFENTSVDFAKVSDAFTQLSNEYSSVIVEGIGGWETPLTKDQTFGDLAAFLKLPVVLVVTNRLGSLSHAILSINAIKQRGLQCAGIIFNSLTDEWDAGAITNRGVIEEITGVPVLAELIYGQDYLDVDELIAALS